MRQRDPHPLHDGAVRRSSVSVRSRRRLQSPLYLVHLQRVARDAPRLPQCVDRPRKPSTRTAPRQRAEQGGIVGRQWDRVRCWALGGNNLAQRWWHREPRQASNGETNMVYATPNNMVYGIATVVAKRRRCNNNDWRLQDARMAMAGTTTDDCKARTDNPSIFDAARPP